MDKNQIHRHEAFVVKHTDKDGKVNWVQDHDGEPIVFSEQNARNLCISDAYTVKKVLVTYTLQPD